MTNLKRILIFLTLALALTLALSIPALADYIIAQESGPDTSVNYVTMGQSFTTIGAGRITQIDVYVGAMNGRTTDLRIYSGGQQPDNPAVALYVQTGISVSCSDCWFSIPLTTPLDVSGATLYTFEFTNTQWRFDTSNPYSGGTVWQDNTSYPSFDFAFRVHHVEEVGLALTKSVSPSSARPGEAITYTISFSNTGAITATNVIITDTLSANLTGVSFTSSGVALTQVPGSRYAWTAPDLLQGDGGVITITGVLSKPLAAGTIPNTVTLAVSGTVQSANVDLTVQNVAPVANAGLDQSKNISSTVTLNGSGTDDNGDTLTYGWAQTGGSSTVTLSAPTAQAPTFTAPSTAGILTFTLTVTDTGALTGTDEVVVTVTAGTPGYASMPPAGGTIQFGLDLGGVKVGSTVTSTLTISETGNATLDVTGHSLSGTNAADFSVSPATLSIADGDAAQQLYVRCTPGAPGLRAATLTVNHNAADSPATYTLNCTGKAMVYLPLVLRATP